MSNVARHGIVAGGNWIVDRVKVIDEWPAQDSLATIIKESDGNGGCPYNVLKNLAKLNCGFPLYGIGLIGHDADGEKIISDCDSYQINRNGLLKTHDAPTSYTDVMTSAQTGRRTFFHQHGANALLDQCHFDLDKIPAKIFFLGYMGLLWKLDQIDRENRTGASRLFERARELGFITATDLVSNELIDFRAVVNPSLPYVDYLFLNELELALLTEGRFDKEDGYQPARMEAQAEELLQRGVCSAVVVHFSGGAMCVQKNHSSCMQSAVRIPQSMILGAAGAGDAFSAGFILGIHEGWEIPRCLELAVCAAATSLRDPTCSASVEAWQNCLEFGYHNGFHESFETANKTNGLIDQVVQ
ncbi:MAG TPA: carbohydrate kinase family protein [Verrucomicrobiae bacterium]|nr:carbohydrate kinase family protein [Verrucomicrobiae bacterium]